MADIISSLFILAVATASIFLMKKHKKKIAVATALALAMVPLEVEVAGWTFFPNGDYESASYYTDIQGIKIIAYYHVKRNRTVVVYDGSSIEYTVIVICLLEEGDGWGEVHLIGEETVNANLSASVKGLTRATVDLILKTDEARFKICVYVMKPEVGNRALISIGCTIIMALAIAVFASYERYEFVQVTIYVFVFIAIILMIDGIVKCLNYLGPWIDNVVNGLAWWDIGGAVKDAFRWMFTIFVTIFCFIDNFLMFVLPVWLVASVMQRIIGIGAVMQHPEVVQL